MDTPKTYLLVSAVVKYFYFVTIAYMMPDGISCKVLKACTDILAPPFQRLFQHSVNTGQIPAQWRLSLIIPVPKHNRPKEINDLTPVGLTSVSMKCFEEILLNLLIEVLSFLDTFLLTSQEEGWIADND